MARRHVPGILVVYDFIRPYAATVLEHATAFERHSRFPVWSINTANGFPGGIADLEFDVLLLHYSLFGTSRYRFDDQFRAYFDDVDSYKVAFFQDEYYFCGQRFAFLNEVDVDCVYTLLEPQHVAAVYGKHTNVRRVESTIPGLVSSELLAAANAYARSPSDRSVDIGYRARRLPFYMGRGGQEKHEIGAKFLERARDLDLVLDIAVEERSRLYDDAWYRFLGDCRAVLGVESGVSIFDIENVVLRSCDELLAREPELTFEEVFERVLRPWEGNIPYRTISPRHFEAAAFRCCQILYEGDYSGVLEPMRHYIPLRKDFSNFAEVVGMFRDEPLRSRIIATTHDDLIGSGRYTYQAFVARFDQVLEEEGIRPRHGAWEVDVTHLVRYRERVRVAEHRARRWLRGQRQRVRDKLDRVIETARDHR